MVPAKLMAKLRLSKYTKEKKRRIFFSQLRTESPCRTQVFQTQFDCKEKMKGKIDESEGIYLTLKNPFKEANNSAVCTLNWLIDLYGHELE